MTNSKESKVDEATNVQFDEQPPNPNPDLKSLDRLTGTWELNQYRRVGLPGRRWL